MKKLIPGYPAYRISSDGVLESRWQRGTFYDGFEVQDVWRVCNLQDHEGGYLYTNLRDGRGGGRKVAVHTLVAEAFLGEKPSPKHCVRHLDGNPKNNNSSNLAWGTYKQNEDDKHRHGTWWNRSKGSKLNAEKVMEIKACIQRGEKDEDIAVKYSVSRPTINRIKNGIIWRNI